MAQVTITINSREYAVACEDGQEVRILQLARMLDKGNPAAATPNADNRQRILEIDRVTAEALDKIAAEINSVAKQIESL